MKFCIVIPCFDHSATVVAVAQAAQAFCPVIVVDDGSIQLFPELAKEISLIRFVKNRGKGAALRSGLQHAAKLGFTHAITMDADGQHFAKDLPKFFAASQAQPDALIVGVRDFLAAGCPTHRRRSNVVSTFWFHVETGVRLGDTQCGFRCYPLALAQRLKTRSGRYAFELEFMIRAAWVGTRIIPVPVKCTYEPDQLRQSHFRLIKDFSHIAFVSMGLALQAWFVPETLRATWSLGGRKGFRQAAKEIFSDHAHEPVKLALAVGLGLFFGFAPIWGFQLIVAIALAHRLGLNKAVTAVASNVSIPPFAPFILYGGLLLGHRMFTDEALNFSPKGMTLARAREYGWQWFVGSVALAAIVAALGTITTYGVARMIRKR